ncbi:DNRLRE domain-containing protein [Streptomyces sp. NBC_00459]|uniref:DNRLRE domain-containing protein n=1 Tax=Streptomyces sp. NBC_00459 TaxID=2975749 RepID=UPI002E16D84A
MRSKSRSGRPSRWGGFARPGSSRRAIGILAAAALVAEAALTLSGSGTAVALPGSGTAKAGAATSASAAADRPAKARYGAAEAKDATSAQLTARLQNRKIEVLSERTTDSTTYALPDGSMRTEAYAGPIRVQEDGAWHDIDTSLADTGADLEPQVAAADIAVSDGGDTDLASVTKGGRSFGVGWTDKLPTPTVKDATASYDLGEGQTLTATALAQGFSENVTLGSRPSDRSVSYRIPLHLKGLTLAQAGSGHLLLKDSGGKLVAEAPAPMMWDSSKDPASGESAHQEQVTTKVETADDGTQTLVLTPDAHFLDTATYPVTVDPTTTLAVTTDTWVQTPDYTDSQVSSQELKSGTYDSGSDVARAYLKFDVSKFAGTDITSATMKLYNYYSSTCSTSGAATQARRITSSWSSSSVTWSAQPTTTTTGVATNTGHWGYSSSCPAAWSSWNMQPIVQAWADGSANYGVQLRSADETDPTTWRRFRSANYTTSGYAPQLVVTYNSYPTKPTSAAVSPSAVNAYSGKRYVTTYTPTLSAKVSDADGSTVKAQFEITNDPAYADTTYSYTATSSSVSSGGTATLTIPSASQLAAAHLRLRVRGYDGTDYGSWSSYVYFVPNVAKPAVPTVSCDAYPSGVWTDKSDSGATCTLDTSSSDGQGYAWGLDDSAVPNKVFDTADGNGGDPLTVHITPANGWHTLYARTIDSGGNVSTSTTSYAFGVGRAGLVTPVTGDTTDDDVTLSATQSGAFTGVTYQFRIGDSVGWQPIPVADVTKDGSAVSSWPVSFASSANPADLTWAATSQLSDDGPVQVRALFTDGTNTYGTDPATVTIDRKADNAPSSAVGPGSVNLLTGDFGLDATDVGAFGAAITRTFSSRDPLAGAGQSGQVAVFGPNWTSGITASTSDWTYVRPTSTTSVAVMDATGGQTGFTLSSSGAWTPEPGAENLTLTLAGDTYTLKDTGGSVTTFSKVAGTAPTWQAATSYAVSNSGANTTTVASRAVHLADGEVLAEPQYVIAPTSAVSATTCASAPSTADCRVLEFVYASGTTATSSALGDYAGQVSQIKLWATAPGGSAATATPVAQYAYDTSGRLREAWDPRLSTPLKTAYTYDSAGRVATETDPGELPWTFTYDKVGTNGDAGDGMLLTASRPTLKAGSASVTDGTATTSVVYDVPVSGTSAPNQLAPATTATWGQHDNPVYGAAVFPASATTPSSHDGSTLGSGAYTTAAISYLDANGREVNTAVPGGHLATTEYDSDGDVTRELTAGNRELALGSTTSRDPILAGAIAGAGSPAQAADLLSTVSQYTTGTGGATLLSDVYDPLHTVTLQHTLPGGTSDADLAAGTEVPARAHTAYAYDEGRPSGATVSGLLTSTTVGAAVTGYPADGDTTKDTSTYDWTTGLPLTGVTDPSGLALTTAYTYDSDGNLLTSTGADKNATTRTVTTYWSATGSGTCQGRPEWAGLTCRVAPGAAVTGGGSNPSELVTKAYTYDRLGEPDTLTETANGSTRTTTFSRDAAGRVTKKVISGGQGTGTPDTTYAYDPSTGLLATQTANSQTITHAYDSLGRQISYADGSGNTTTTAYDSLNRPVTVTDSVPSTTTYTYDSTTGYPAKVTDSAAGTFTATAYDADGDLTAETLPGGYTLTQTYDTIGSPTGRTYTDSAGTTVLDDQADYTILGMESGHAENNGASTSTAYTYDGAGRLTEAQDDTGATCTTRAYTFASATSWDRTKLTTDTSTADCADTTTTTTTTATHTYDSADRVTDTGYTYDAYGRTLTTPDATLTYYTDDLARSEATGTAKQTWALDAAHRQAVTANATSTDGGTTWTSGTTATNHYADDTDSPTWTADSSGTVTRSVPDVGGALGATTSATGAVTLQLADLHGDTAVTLATATTTATAYSYDEYGNTTAAIRYGWQGSSRRASDTPTGLTLMGLRLYNPTTGRFLQTDPVTGGSATSYDYCNGDPVNCQDLNGQCPSWKHPVKKSLCKAAVWATEYGIEAVGEVFCGAVATVAFALCSAMVTGLSSAVSYYVETRWDGGFSWGEAISNFVIAAFAGGVLGGATMRFLKTSTGKTFLRKARSFIARAAEKVENKVAAKVGLHLHLTGLVTRITNVIKSRLG